MKILELYNTGKQPRVSDRMPECSGSCLPRRSDMAHVAQIRTEEEAAQINWPCHWCINGKIGRYPPEICSICRKHDSNAKPTEFEIAITPR